MALTEEQLEVLGERLVPLFRQFERAVINDIARRLRKTERLTETAEIMAETLRDKGFSPVRIRQQVMALINADKQLQEAIAANTLEAKKLLAEEIRILRENVRVEAEGLWEDAGNMAFSNDLSVWMTDAKPVKGAAFEQLVKAMAQNATDDVLNLTKTMAFRTTTGDLVRAQRAYNREVNLALTKVASGAYSYGQAIEEAVRDLARSGIRTVEFESGATRQVDTAVRNAVMTASSQLAGQITMQNVEQTGVDYVEVSAHWGAREGEGHANHAGWQGKVYRVQGSDGEHENLEMATGYPSDPKGLCGYNCRHTFYPFWPGLSEPNEWPPEPGPFEVDGKTYTYYQATQAQRRKEREIRALKRERAAYEAAGWKDLAKETERKIRLKTTEYMDFSADLGIRAKTERLRVLDGSGELSYNASRKVNKALDEQAKRISSAREQMASAPKSVNSGHQGKHVRGSSNFDETRSELTYDAQKLIDLYAETADPILDTKGEWTHKGRFTHSEPIGISKTRGRPDVETKSGIMHYSKKGIHIVPSRPPAEKG